MDPTAGGGRNGQSSRTSSATAGAAVRSRINPRTSAASRTGAVQRTEGRPASRVRRLLCKNHLLSRCKLLVAAR
jgi:hypothetical protein